MDEKTLLPSGNKITKTTSYTLWRHKLKIMNFFEELKIQFLFRIIQNYRSNWKQRERRMENNITQILIYKSRGKRNLERAQKKSYGIVRGHVAKYLTWWIKNVFVYLCRWKYLNQFRFHNLFSKSLCSYMFLFYTPHLLILNNNNNKCKV